MDPRTDLFKNKTFLAVKDPFPIRTIALNHFENHGETPNISEASAVIGRAAVKGNKEERFEGLDSLYYDDATISAKHLNLYFTKVVETINEKNNDDYDPTDDDLEQLAGLDQERSHTVVLIRDVSQHGAMVLRHQHTKPIILEKGKLNYLLNGDILGLVVLDELTPPAKSNCFDIFRDTKVQFQIATDYKDKFTLIKLDGPSFLSIDSKFKKKLADIEESPEFLFGNSFLDAAKLEYQIDRFKRFLEDTLSYSKRVWMYTPCAIDFTDHVFRSNYNIGSRKELLEDCIKMFITVDCEAFLPELECLTNKLDSNHKDNSSQAETSELIDSEVTPEIDSYLELSTESDYEVESEYYSDSIIDSHSENSTSSNIINLDFESSIETTPSPDVEIISEIKREGTSSDDPSLLKKSDNSIDNPIELDSSTSNLKANSSAVNIRCSYSTGNGPIIIDRETTADNPIIIDHDLSSGKNIILDLMKRPFPGNMKIDIESVPGIGKSSCYMEELKLKLQQRNKENQKKSVALTVSDLVNPIVKGTKTLSVQDMINDDERESEESDEDYEDNSKEDLDNEVTDFSEEEEEEGNYSNDIVPFSEIGKTFMDVKFDKDPQDDESYIESELDSDDTEEYSESESSLLDFDLRPREEFCLPFYKLSNEKKAHAVKTIISGENPGSFNTTYYSAVKNELDKCLGTICDNSGLATLLNEDIESSSDNDYDSEEEQQDYDIEGDESDSSDFNQDDSELSEDELFSTKSDGSDLETDKSFVNMVEYPFDQKIDSRLPIFSSLQGKKRKFPFKSYRHDDIESTSSGKISCLFCKPEKVVLGDVSLSESLVRDERTEQAKGIKNSLEDLNIDDDDDVAYHIEDGPALKKLKLSELEIKDLHKTLEEANHRLAKYQANTNTELRRRNLKDKLKSVALGILIGSVGTVSALMKLSSSLPENN